MHQRDPLLAAAARVAERGPPRTRRPKQVELNHYEQVPHLLTPVVTQPRLAANVLANLIGEMEARYQVMGELRARNLVELNLAKRVGSRRSRTSCA